VVEGGGEDPEADLAGPGLAGLLLTWLGEVGDVLDVGGDGIGLLLDDEGSHPFSVPLGHPPRAVKPGGTRDK
jgi:hypothetical protein